MITVLCLECKEKIILFGQPAIGEHIRCPKCKTEQEVIWLYPLSLDYPEEDLLAVAAKRAPGKIPTKSTEV